MTFPTTAWHLLDDARDGHRDGSDRYRDAINRLTCVYWRPIYGFLRARGTLHEAAEELTQEFWLECFEKRTLLTADRTRGRFRTFLLAVLKNFAADRAPGRCRRQDAFEMGLVPVSVLIKEGDTTLDRPTNATPDEIFMQRWAQSIVAEVREQLRTWCLEKGRPDWLDTFERFHFPAQLKGHPSQNQLADELGVSRDQVRYAIEQTGAHFAQALREMLADQVSDRSDTDAELAELQRLLGAS